MRPTIIYILILIQITSCIPDRKKLVDESELKFSTTDASEMFFKNLRQSAYVVENRKDAGITVNKNRKLFNSSCALKPSLVFNWRSDKAFVIFDNLELEQYVIRIGNQVMFFDPSYQKNHALLAVSIYNGIISNQPIEISTQENHFSSFFNDDEEKDYFRVAIYDFLRMVEIR